MASIWDVTVPNPFPGSENFGVTPTPAPAAPAPAPTQTTPTTVPSPTPLKPIVDDIVTGTKKLIGNAGKALGVGKSGGGAQRKASNPPFHPRILRLYDLTGSGTVKLTRGYIRTDTSSNATIENLFYLYFLYNPSVLNLEHAVDLDIAAAKIGNTPEGAGNYLFPLSQSFSFDLLFDRTYDVMTGDVWPDRGNVPMAEVGVYADVLVLYDMLGITNSVEVTNDEVKDFSAIGSGNQGTLKVTPPMGPMTAVPLRFYFGKQLNFKAYITGLQIQYTHWTQRMVPNRCTISITAQLLPDVIGAAGNLKPSEAKRLTPGSPNSYRNGKPNYGGYKSGTLRD